MATVKWSASNNEKIKILTPKNRLSARYEQTNIETILGKWPDKLESKLVKVTCGRGNLIEFDIYNSNPFLTYNNKINRFQNIEVYDGLFAINILRVKLGQSATEVVAMVQNLNCSKMPKTWYYTRDHWFEKEELSKILYRLEEIMGYLPEYEVMDILFEYS